MEDNEWVHKGSKWCCKVVHPLVLMQPNCCYVNTWSKHSLQMQIGRLRCPVSHHGGHMQQDHGYMNARILNNPHASQKWNVKETFDQMKKKVKLKRDELDPSATNHNAKTWHLHLND